jgi:transposase
MIKGEHEAATVAATDGGATARIEIVGERRRAYDAAFRTKVVAESVAAGARVREVARRHGICPSLLYRWRRAAEANNANGSRMRLFPVRIAASPDPPPPRAPVSASRRAGLIEIELAGGVRVSVDEGVSLAALRRVMLILRER